MRLGILADIHEEVRWLGLALDRFREEQVDQVVVLGDVFCTGRKIEETIDLLRRVNPVGVWGNHDFGLCHEPEPAVRDKYRGPVLDFMTSLRPRWEVGACLFTHVEPWLDPTDLADLWYFDGPPDTPEKVARSFAAVSHRILFVGHFHRWLLAGPAGVLPWEGTEPVRLGPGERYLVVVAAVCDGQCAVFDTVENLLVPCRLKGAEG